MKFGAHFTYFAYFAYFGVYIYLINNKLERIIYNSYLLRLTSAYFAYFGLLRFYSLFLYLLRLYTIINQCFKPSEVSEVSEVSKTYPISRKNYFFSSYGY
jgi:hypothetical protein